MIGDKGGEDGSWRLVHVNHRRRKAGRSCPPSDLERAMPVSVALLLGRDLEHEGLARGFRRVFVVSGDQRVVV